MILIKIYIISDDIRENHPEFKKKWICDILKEELEIIKLLSKYINNFILIKNQFSQRSQPQVIWWLLYEKCTSIFLLKI